MNYLSMFIFCLIMIESFFYYNIYNHLKNILFFLKKIVKIISSKKISDFWKQKSMLMYSSKIFNYYLNLMLWLFCVVSVFVLFSFFVEGFLLLFCTVKGNIYILMLSASYIFVRNKLKKDG
jgi:hypothetical protein